jgi:hypothetical protein
MLIVAFENPFAVMFTSASIHALQTGNHLTALVETGLS